MPAPPTVTLRPLTLRFDAAPPEHALQLLQRGHVLTDSAVTIGRVDSNDIVLPDPRALLAPRHCRIAPVDGAWHLSDFSVNGTFLNGVLVGRFVTRPIAPGDRLQ